MRTYEALKTMVSKTRGQMREEINQSGVRRRWARDQNAVAKMKSGSGEGRERGNVGGDGQRMGQNHVGLRARKMKKSNEVRGTKA